MVRMTKTTKLFWVIKSCKEKHIDMITCHVFFTCILNWLQQIYSMFKVWTRSWLLFSILWTWQNLQAVWLKKPVVFWCSTMQLQTSSNFILKILIKVRMESMAKWTKSNRCSLLLIMRCGEDSKNLKLIPSTTVSGGWHSCSHKISHFSTHWGSGKVYSPMKIECFIWVYLPFLL